MLQRNFVRFFLVIMTCMPLSFAAAVDRTSGSQTNISTQALPDSKYSVIIYTLSTCPHCRDAKEYFSRRQIPFIDREVDTDKQHMTELMKIYDAMGVPKQTRGVPLIIIGDTIRLQGFNQEEVEKALATIPAP